MRVVEQVLLTVLIVLCTPALSWAQNRASEAPVKDATADEEKQWVATDRLYGEPSVRARTTNAVRIATYNIENFFDAVDDPSLQGEFDDAAMVTPTHRCEALARTIRAVDADVIALQEVESAEALTWFRDTYLEDMGYVYLQSIDVGYKRGVENAILSRFPIEHASILEDVNLDGVERTGIGWDDVPEDMREGLVFRRAPLRVDVRFAPDYICTLIVVHHKAGWNKFYREAEALKLIESIEQLESADPSRNIAVLGDFNAAPWDKSLRVYLEQGMVDTMAHRTVPPANLPQEEANLFKTHSSGRVLDYVLCNSAMYREYVAGSAHIYGTLAPPEGWNWRTDEHPLGYASDHYPVIIEIMPCDGA